MKVLLVNGSPNKNGCTYAALSEVSVTLNSNGIETEIFHIGMNRYQVASPVENAGNWGIVLFQM